MQGTFLERAWRGAHAWLHWSMGYEAGRGKHGVVDIRAMDELEWMLEDLDAAWLLRWVFSYVPHYRDLSSDRERWEHFWHEQRRAQRMEGDRGWQVMLACAIGGWE